MMKIEARWGKKSFSMAWVCQSAPADFRNQTGG